MSRSITLSLALLSCLFLNLPVHAAEVAGIKLEERSRVGNADLVLNGAGVRSRFFIKVYVAALYLPARQSQASEILNARAPKRMQLSLLRDVPADHFMAGLHKGIEQNLSPSEREAIKTRLEGFDQLMRGLDKAREGDVVTLDENDAGTLVSVNGKPLGAAIPGADFYRALVRVWLGDKPVQDDLKRALLGGIQ